MISSKWLLKNFIVLLFFSFKALAGICPLCDKEGHTPLDCPKRNSQPNTGASQSTGIDISDLPGMPGGGASAGGAALAIGDGATLLMQHLSSAFQKAEISSPDDQRFCPPWLSDINKKVPKSYDPDDQEYKVPILSEELANAQQSNGYIPISQATGQEAITLLKDHLALSSCQYLMHYQRFGEEAINQIYLLETDLNGQLYALSDTFGFWDTVSPVATAQDFINEVFPDIDDGDIVNLYLADSDRCLTPTNQGNSTPDDEEDGGAKTPIYPQ